MKTYIIIIILLFLSHDLFAASCCGGGSSSSLIIIGDNQSEFALGITYRTDLGQTDNLGWASFHGDKVIDQQLAFNFQFQKQLSERFQVAVKSTLIEKHIEKQNRSEKKTGPGDFDLQATYEYLPEYTYSVWKPRGFIYSKLSVPQSKSLYDSNSILFSDVRGSGLYAAGIGSFFIKHLTDYTLKVTFEWQHFFGRDFGVMTLKDYDKIIIPLGLSYSFTEAPIAIGFGSTFSYQTPKHFKGSINATSNKEYFWEFNSFINWIINREDSVGLGYSDSTLIGKNINSSLYRSVAVTYTRSNAL
jgi:hypothetical protein